MTKIKICQDGVLIAVECKAWAENIKHDRMERKGLAHFEVFIFLFNVFISFIFFFQLMID